MKPNLNLELFYSDTDSFIYAIQTDDVYQDLEKIKADFDFSSYDVCSRIPTRKFC